MSRYRKKPVVIDAIHWVGEIADIGTFLDESSVRRIARGEPIEIPTLEGTMTADIGDWIIRGVKGEFYPCKPDVFEATYKPVDAS